MTDAVNSFYEDIAVRSKQKNSAHHKKNGSAVTKLGKKPLTKKEILAKHGPVETYDLNSFMDFNKFKSMSKDLQVEYVNRLQEKYDIGIKHISLHLFNIGEEGLRSHLKINGILNQCNPDKKRMKTGLDLFVQDIDEAKRIERMKEFMDVIDVSDKFITYDEYLSYDTENRLRYVNGLIDKYHVSCNTISEVLFQKNGATLYAYFSSKKMNDAVSKVGRRDPVETIVCNNRFREEVYRWRGEAVPKEEPRVDIVDIVLPEETKEEPIVETIKMEDFPVTNMEIPPVEELEETVAKAKGATYESRYISEGIRIDEIYALGILFKDKKVKVEIRIEEVE